MHRISAHSALVVIVIGVRFPNPQVTDAAMSAMAFFFSGIFVKLMGVLFVAAGGTLPIGKGVFAPDP